MITGAPAVALLGTGGLMAVVILFAGARFSRYKKEKAARQLVDDGLKELQATAEANAKINKQHNDVEHYSFIDGDGKSVSGHQMAWEALTSAQGNFKLKPGPLRAKGTEFGKQICP